MRGRKLSKLSLKILEVIGEAAVATATVIEAITSSPYGASNSRLRKSIREIERRRGKGSSDNIPERKLRDVLYRLNRDGLIAKKTDRAWALTAKGRGLLAFFRKTEEEHLPEKKYPKENTNELKIIIFDIPEKFRRKRDWLRGTLENLGFEMLQKSVWAGKCLFPEELLHDLEQLNILKYVEVLAVTKAGSLKTITPNSRS